MSQARTSRWLMCPLLPFLGHGLSSSAHAAVETSPWRPSCSPSAAPAAVFPLLSASLWQKPRTVPVTQRLPQGYLVRITSDSWKADFRAPSLMFTEAWTFAFRILKCVSSSGMFGNSTLKSVRRRHRRRRHVTPQGQQMPGRVCFMPSSASSPYTWDQRASS